MVHTSIETFKRLSTQQATHTHKQRLDVVTNANFIEALAILRELLTPSTVPAVQDREELHRVYTLLSEIHFNLDSGRG